MFDSQLRSLKDRLFNPLATRLRFTPPWLFSVVGLVVGLAGAVALWQRAYGLGFWLCFGNRCFDALDGAVSRQSGKQSDLGGYLDIVFDFVIYAAVPAGLVFGRPSTTNYVALIFLLASFYVNAAAWMYLAAILEKRNQAQTNRLTSVTMPAGLIGGGETILFFGLFILFPAYLPWLFGLMTLLLILTIAQRLWWATSHLT